MYTIQNTSTAIPKTAKSQLRYFDIVAQSVGQTTAQGVSISELDLRIKLLNKFEDKEAESADITDEDYVLLKACVENTKYRIIHRDVMAFVKYIQDLQPNKK